MKKSISIFLIICVFVTFAFANGEKEQGINEKLNIGSVIMNTSGEWFAEVIEGMEQAGEDLNVNVSIVSSDNEISKEADNVDRFIAQDVDAIAISPLSPNGSVATVESIKENDIPVIVWNSSVNTEIDGLIGVSNYDLGYLTGEYASEYINKEFADKETVNMSLLTNSCYEQGVARVTGFKDAIAKCTKVKIVATQDAELTDEGVDITEQLLVAHPETDVFWCWNQTSLLGCLAVLENMEDSTTVVMGTDMSVDIAKTMLGNGVNLQAVTTQMPYDMGYQSIKLAVDAIKGIEVPETTIIPLKTYLKTDTADLKKYIEEHESLINK